MVCDKGGCERWCVTKLYGKDGGWQSCVWKMVCDKVVWERWWLTKLCVKDGVWQSCMWKMVCDKIVCERWCVTGGGRRRREEAPGIQNQNKNPTQRCGECIPIVKWFRLAHSVTTVYPEVNFSRCEHIWEKSLLENDLCSQWIFYISVNFLQGYTHISSSERIVMMTMDDNGCSTIKNQ